jgi:hypothetical protein
MFQKLRFVMVDTIHSNSAGSAATRKPSSPPRFRLIQALISDYERDKLRMNSDTILRFAGALEVSTDELLRPSKVGRYCAGWS